MLTNLNKDEISRQDFIKALKEKCVERNTIAYLETHKKYIDLIRDSLELRGIWENYQNRNKYAQGIEWIDIMNSLEYLLSI